MAGFELPHCIAADIEAPVEIGVQEHVGYYCAGMNQQAQITIKGRAGLGVAENMMPILTPCGVRFPLNMPLR